MNYNVNLNANAGASASVSANQPSGTHEQAQTMHSMQQIAFNYQSYQYMKMDISKYVNPYCAYNNCYGTLTSAYNPHYPIYQQPMPYPHNNAGQGGCSIYSQNMF